MNKTLFRKKKNDCSAGNRYASREGDIAIIGISCRFPGADNYHEYWRNLREGRNCISKIPEGRWKHDKVDGNGASHVKSAILRPSETNPIHNGELMFGTWQNIAFAELDGPRSNRKVIIQIVENIK